MKLVEQRTIALAGVIQACAQVQSLAREGQVDQAAYAASLNSVLVLDASTTLAIYGGMDGIRSGLALLADGLMSSPQYAKVEILRYVMSLLHLQNQLYRDDSRFASFAQAVERLSASDKDQFESACSDVYQHYISELKPQIIVQGEEDYLQQEGAPEQVRALLLAGIRSSALWQQKDGGRFKLIWQRSQMQDAARRLLNAHVVH